MSSDYMEALRVQLDLIQRFRTDALHAASTQDREVASVAHLLVSDATPIYVARWVIQSVLEAAAALPTDLVLTPDQLPTERGFACWPSPQPSGMAWGVLDGTLDYIAFRVEESGPHAVIYGAWDIGSRIADLTLPLGALSEDKILQLRTTLYALWAFMRERRATTVTHRGVDRALRKQAERSGWTHEPIVQVVELRASEPRPHDADGDHAAVDWACRWAVRGHWHKYHYGDGTLRARWVAPYVKGPAGKPLRAATKLLAVVR